MCSGVEDKDSTPESDLKIYGLKQGTYYFGGEYSGYYFNRYRKFDISELKDKGSFTLLLRGLQPSTWYGNKNVPEENVEEQIFPMSGSDLAQDYVMEKKMKEIAQPYGDPVYADMYNLYQNKNYGQPINVDMTQLFLGAYVSMEIDQNIGHTIAGKYYYIPGTNIYEDAVQIPSFTTKAKASQFTDVNANTPHHEDIAWLAEHKISEGYKKPDGSYQFGGMTSVYRQDMAAFLHRLDALLTK